MKRRAGFAWAVAVSLAAFLLWRWTTSASDRAPASPSAPLVEVAPAPAAAFAGSKPAATNPPAPAASAVPPGAPSIAVKKREWAPIKPYPNVSAALLDLGPAAEAGDPAAMIAISRALQFCLDGISDPDNQRWIRRNAPLLGITIDADYEPQIAAKARYCDLPSTQIIADNRRWVLKAADTGDVDAQIYAALRPPPIHDMVTIERIALETGADDRKLLYGGESRELSLQYARLARDRGELLGALILVSSDTDGGGPVSDVLESYENALLLSRIGESHGRPAWGNSLEVRSAHLHPYQRVVAEQQVQAWLDQVPTWTQRSNAMPEDIEMAEAIAAANAAAARTQAGSP